MPKTSEIDEISTQGVCHRYLPRYDAYFRLGGVFKIGPKSSNIPEYTQLVLLDTDGYPIALRVHEFTKDKEHRNEKQFRRAHMLLKTREDKKRGIKEPDRAESCS